LLGSEKELPLSTESTENEGADIVPIKKPVEEQVPTPAQMTEAQLAIKRAFWTDVLNQVIDTPRFLNFMDNNYRIERAVDEETKTIQIRITEKIPKLDITGEQIFKLHHACISHGIKDASKLIERIIQILGGTASSIVTPAEEEEMKRVQQLRDSLDP
jgi:hypothetical protein